jgi:hypothetical protein
MAMASSAVLFVFALRFGIGVGTNEEEVFQIPGHHSEMGHLSSTFARSSALNATNPGLPLSI